MVPLVIRANLGGKIVVTFSHSLNRPLSIHVQGLSYDVQTSDGANVGYNPDTTTKRKIVYTWYDDKEGVFIFHDMGDSTGNEDPAYIFSSLVHGDL